MKLEAQWIVGFVDGEGCFHVGFNGQPSMRLKVQVLPEFTVVQHKRDVQLLHALKSHFGCGVVRTNHGDRLAFRVRGHNNLHGRVLPFFEKHKLKSRKRVDFERFRDVVRMMDDGKHLTLEGLAQIREIAGRINAKEVQLSAYPSSATG